MNQDNIVVFPNDAIRESLDSALSFLDENTKIGVIAYLKRNYGINLEGDRTTAEDVQIALGLAFGQGSQMIISRMNKRLKEITCAL
ncbi:MAG: hypothetical protein ABI361_09440 [Nitrososphaera sp.]|jgi:hypothetical protein